MSHPISAQRLAILLLAFIFATSARGLAADDSTSRCFVIEVIDSQTGRGVPLVELKTVSNLRYYTDSNGLVAINDPSLMNQKVYFNIQSPGYEFPADGFGFRGKAMEVVAGKSTTLKIKRLNIAERLYRVTGQGIYRATIEAGRKAPIDHPLLNAQVVGQDSVQAMPYEGKLFWFWGDTSRLSYPLGHFGTAGATSFLPEQGGLDPSVGVNLTYFTDKSGFSRPTVVLPGDGPKWIDGLMTVKDAAGKDTLVARYARVNGKMETLERGLIRWDDASASWKLLERFDLKSPLYPDGQPVRFTSDGVDYYYFRGARVPADLKSITDPSKYQAMTCLVAGTRYAKGDSQLDRRPDGSLNWDWKADTSPVGAMQERELIQAGKMKRGESRFLLEDVATHRTVVPHYGSVCWNAYRKRWILIAVQIDGRDALLGDVWYAEAQSPIGPWHWAIEIARHPHYSFYNPVQHPFFDQEGGRIIYFEGTYSNTFSGNDHPTPLYDYNQIMYRLDLSDPSLKMPAP